MATVVPGQQPLMPNPAAALGGAGAVNTTSGPAVGASAGLGTASPVGFGCAKDSVQFGHDPAQDADATQPEAAAQQEEQAGGSKIMNALKWILLLPFKITGLVWLYNKIKNRGQNSNAEAAAE